MSNWIFIATDQETPSGTMSASDIYSRLMKEGGWGLGERTPNRGKIQDGDRVVFYLGRPQIQFVGRQGRIKNILTIDRRIPKNNTPRSWRICPGRPPDGSGGGAPPGSSRQWIFDRI